MDEDTIKKNEKVYHGYDDTSCALYRENEEILTTQISLLHAKLFHCGYRIFVREHDENTFEIKLGDNERTNRIIRDCHNLEKMLIAGEFDII